MHKPIINSDPLTYQIKIMNAKDKSDGIYVPIEQQIV